jgi:hypothetical protein
MTSFMCFATASVAVSEPDAEPDAGFQYSATEPRGTWVPAPAMSAQPMTVLPRPLTMPLSVFTSLAYRSWVRVVLGTSSPPMS